MTVALIVVVCWVVGLLLFAAGYGLYRWGFYVAAGTLDEVTTLQEQGVEPEYMPSQRHREAYVLLDYLVPRWVAMVDAAAERAEEEARQDVALRKPTVPRRGGRHQHHP